MKRQTFNDINITPLTDIFLVLLILMMVIAPILDQQGLSLAVPEFVENTNNKETKVLTVTVTSNDKFMINENEVAREDLLNTLKEQKETYPDGLLIQASGNSTHDSVVTLMDSARNAGVSSISIVEL